MLTGWAGVEVGVYMCLFSSFRRGKGKGGGGGKEIGRERKE